MKKTAMIELRDKLLEEYQNLKDPSHNHEYLNGYREALKNVANDIDAQMAQIEYKIIVNAYAAGCSIEDGVFTAVEKGVNHYEKLYGKLS
jgi:hypothetical protein